jgi:hypothetical protein
VSDAVELFDIALQGYICRLRAEAARKASKKHVESTTAWNKQHKDKVRAAERKHREIDAEDVDIDQTAAASKNESGHSDSEDSECEHVPLHEQVFFPREVRTKIQSFRHNYYPSVLKSATMECERLKGSR